MRNASFLLLRELINVGKPQRNDWKKYEVFRRNWFLLTKLIYSYPFASMVPPITRHLRFLCKHERTFRQFALTNSLHFGFWIEALLYDLVRTLQIWWATRQFQVFRPVISQLLPATVGMKPWKNAGQTFFTRVQGFVTAQLQLCRC